MLDDIRERHHPDVASWGNGYCSYCFRPWPCDAFIAFGLAEEAAQQERERLRTGLMKVALADGWPRDWWERADQQVLAAPEDDR